MVKHNVILAILSLAVMMAACSKTPAEDPQKNQEEENVTPMITPGSAVDEMKLHLDI